MPPVRISAHLSVTRRKPGSSANLEAGRKAQVLPAVIDSGFRRNDGVDGWRQAGYRHWRRSLEFERVPHIPELRPDPRQHLEAEAF